MRKAFQRAVMSAMEGDEKIVLLLGDIGVFSFSEAFKRWPDRVINIGVMEQSMVSVAAGLAKQGFFPIIHTIAPFVVERALEQIKVDLGYHGFGALIVSVGASFDYAALGCTHHCPADVGIMRLVPNMHVYAPGHPTEVEELIASAVIRKNLNYLRLSEYSHRFPHMGLYWDMKFGHGMDATVIAVGPTFNEVHDAAQGLNVTVRYINDVSSNAPVLPDATHSPKFLTVEPYYHGPVAEEIIQVSWPRLVSVHRIGVPRRFLRNYGVKSQHDEAIGLTTDNIRKAINAVIES